MAAVTARKLDRFAKMALRDALRERQSAALKAKHDEYKARLMATALRILETNYRAMQPDMPVLEKYGLCARITGVNLRVRNPETGLFDLRGGGFGLQVETDLKAPESGIRWAGGSEERTTYVWEHLDEDDPDYGLALEVHAWGQSYEAEQKAERDAFEAAMKATSSWRTLAEQYPWINEAFAPLATEAP